MLANDSSFRADASAHGGEQLVRANRLVQHLRVLESDVGERGPRRVARDEDDGYDFPDMESHGTDDLGARFAAAQMEVADDHVGRALERAVERLSLGARDTHVEAL